MNEPPSVYIVDDDENALKPICRVVEAIGLTPRAYSSPDEFLEQYHPTGPACLVLDIMMPGMSGVALQQRLADAGIRLRTIAISAHADVRLAVQVMRNGALNFLEKPFRMQELAESVQEAIRLDQESWRRREEAANAESCFQQLDPRERQIVKLVAAGKTNKMIAAELGISVRTVENRRARIKRKLHVQSRTELLALAASSLAAAAPES
jgi:two-component system, LuxR family, response regulator FixJ